MKNKKNGFPYVSMLSTVLRECKSFADCMTEGGQHRPSLYADDVSRISIIIDICGILRKYH